MSNFEITYRGILVAIITCAILTVVAAGEVNAQSLPVNISFQPASFPLQSGYRGDFGSGYTYGWNVDHTSRTFAYSPLPGYESIWGAQWSLIKMISGTSTTWEIALANGTYDISILAAGYQCQGQLQQIAAE